MDWVATERWILFTIIKKQKKNKQINDYFLTNELKYQKWVFLAFGDHETNTLGLEQNI